MESLFFNITDTKYKITNIFQKESNFIRKIDISNGILFYHISLKDIAKTFTIKNLDRMVFIPTVIDGKFNIVNNIDFKTTYFKTNSLSVVCSSRQDFIFEIPKQQKVDIFILFVSDFFLKRYILNDPDEPIDFLYNKIQNELILEIINLTPIDALSLYIVKKIIDKKDTGLISLKKEHSVIEFLLHNFSLLDIYNKNLNKDELYISKKAKDFLLKEFVNPPTIKVLAHYCATNESKLKKVFKKVFKCTIYEYIQQLKLKEANLLLKEQILNIGEIATSIGYKHQGYFSKLFFEHYGVYPKDLLRKNKKPDSAKIKFV